MLRFVLCPSAHQLAGRVDLHHHWMVIEHSQTSPPVFGWRAGCRGRLNSRQNILHLLLKRLNPLFQSRV
ncbi:MAG UNVERIFIED_CONTAM: hypothetical protein LVR18_24625 [Planctomycetaceae bacterium]